MPENGIQDKVIQVSVLFALVVIEVDEIFNVVVRSDILYILQKKRERGEKGHLRGF